MTLGVTQILDRTRRVEHVFREGNTDELGHAS